MSLTDTINQEIKKAMLAKEKQRLEALRSLKNGLLLAKTEKGAAAELSDQDELKVVQKLVKQRKDSADIYKQQGRDDLYEDEMFEHKVISEFMPEQMDETALTEYIEKLVQEMGASSMQDMGRVMGKATGELAGKADGKMISNIVRKILQ